MHVHARMPRAPRQGRYGVPAPSRTPPSNERDSPAHVSGGSVAKGLTAPALPALILPRHLREDPYSVPPPLYADLEVGGHTDVLCH